MTELIYTLVVTHITIVCVTLYLHRGQAHRGVEFHPVVAHFMRLWLWLTTGMNTRAWVAVHRAHHQYSDTDKDPHSPKVYGIWRVLFGGAFLYVKAKQNTEILKLGAGTPNDWIEKNVYTPHPYIGIFLMLVIDLLLFGATGILVWIVQMIWIPLWAAGVINGIGHHWGYRNKHNNDSSRNLWPLAVWIGGEELHANHHDNGAGAKFSQKWWEFDIGWMYICILKFFRLAQVRRK
jgi:stearoyl-CoA desaturase (delta-9 desaturase)